MKPSKKQIFTLFILIIILTTGCVGKATESAVQTAIAETQTAEPTVAAPTITTLPGQNFQNIELKKALLAPEDIVFLFYQDIDLKKVKYSREGFMSGNHEYTFFDPAYLGWKDSIKHFATFFSISAPNLNAKYEQRIYIWSNSRDAARHTEDLIDSYESGQGSLDSELLVQGDSRIWMGTIVNGWCTAIVAYRNATIIIYIDSSEYLVKDDLMDLIDAAIQKIEANQYSQ